MHLTMFKLLRVSKVTRVVIDYSNLSATPSLAQRTPRPSGTAQHTRLKRSIDFAEGSTRHIILIQLESANEGILVLSLIFKSSADVEQDIHHIDDRTVHQFQSNTTHIHEDLQLGTVPWLDGQVHQRLPEISVYYEGAPWI